MFKNYLFLNLGYKTKLFFKKSQKNTNFVDLKFIGHDGRTGGKST